MFPNEDWSEINDVQYYNSNTKGWSGKSWMQIDPNQDYIKFNQKSLELINEYLAPVFKTGWSSIDLYIFNKHYKSIVYKEQNFIGKPFKYTNANYGCISIILFPLFILLEALIKKGIIGKIERLNLKPILDRNKKG